MEHPNGQSRPDRKRHITELEARITPQLIARIYKERHNGRTKASEEATHPVDRIPTMNNYGKQQHCHEGWQHRTGQSSQASSQTGQAPAQIRTKIQHKHARESLRENNYFHEILLLKQLSTRHHDVLHTAIRIAQEVKPIGKKKLKNMRCFHLTFREKVSISKICRPDYGKHQPAPCHKGSAKIA